MCSNFNIYYQVYLAPEVSSSGNKMTSEKDAVELMDQEPDVPTVTASTDPIIQMNWSRFSRRWLQIALVVGCVLCLVGLICLIVALVRLQESGPACSSAVSGVSAMCKYSAEAERVQLPSLLKNAQQTYYEMNPDNVIWQPDIEEPVEHVKSK